MLNLNNVQLAGNLTRDPEVRFFANEKAVANFGLAINRRYTTATGEKKEETTFIDIECWGRQAELVGQYLTKGRNCLIEGSLKLDTWEDNNGNKRSRIKVLANRVHFIGGNPANETNKAAYQNNMSQGVPEPTDDEPPF